MKDEQVRELLYQALETEIGGVQVYTTALRCVENDDLKEEWEEYLEQTRNHVTIVEDVLTKLELDPDEVTVALTSWADGQRRYAGMSDAEHGRVLALVAPPAITG